MSPLALTLVQDADAVARQLPPGPELRSGGRRNGDDKRACFSPSCGCAARNRARARAPRRAAA
ncbi:hypothetical protein [Streptomyces erythrochromogenes]|uniref:hypothetical protein n=1 Tax=Streptomyces erythrochromogenes TaxID=285574 RepID=UPI00386E1BCB|nr:hypothetical protein OG364_02005 [Streptomyces erythrochromogenes]